MSLDDPSISSIYVLHDECCLLGVIVQCFGFTGGITRLADAEKLLAAWAAESEMIATMVRD